MKHYFCAIIAIFISSLSFASDKQFKLLDPPQEAKSESSKSMFTDAELSDNRFSHGRMSWDSSKKECGTQKKSIIGWSFSSKGKILHLGLAYTDALPEELTEKEKAKFTKETKDENGSVFDVYTYAYHIGFSSDDDESETHKFEMFSHKLTAQQSLKSKLESAFKRSFEKSKEKPSPQDLSIEECVEFIKSHKPILFLTGAGISLASNIPTMQSLHNDLGVSETQAVDSFAKSVLNSPGKIVETLLNFQKALINAHPTTAHLALTRLAMHTKSQIITGNFDGLHEAAGISSYNVEANPLQEDFSLEVAQQIQAIICIGSSYDFQVVLGRYKRLNPLGLIIAINKEQPDYLGDEDFFVQGDIQELVPKLTKLVTEKKEK
jgi:NAD-dependent SIR2 family protein deacetylase